MDSDLKKLILDQLRLAQFHAETARNSLQNILDSDVSARVLLAALNPASMAVTDCMDAIAALEKAK